MVSSADPAVSRRDFAAGETGRGPFIPTNRASNPRAGQWTNAMSHNMIADYKRFLMTDGEGIRCSLYVSGCPFHCEGCYNSSIWDFRAGHEYNDRLEAQIMADLSLPYVQGITFLGGEPLLNTGVLLPLSRKKSVSGSATPKTSGAGRATRGRSSCAKAKAPTSVNCSNRSISSWMAGISRICTIRCCSFAAAPTSASSMCPSRWKAGRWCCGRNYTIRRGSVPEIYGKDRVAGEGAAS